MKHLDQTSRDLLKAAELIEKHGWVRGSFGNKRDGMCAVTALSYARSGWRNNPEFYERLGPLLDGRKSILGFNDAPGRTKEEVIALLQKAALS